MGKALVVHLGNEPPLCTWRRSDFDNRPR